MLPPEDKKLIDAGKRMADSINGLLAFHQPWELRMKWAAVTLEDGSVDSTVYDSIEDARHAKRNSPQQHAYMAFRSFMQGVKPREAEVFIMVWRQAPANIRQGDPDRGRSDIILPIEATDHISSAQMMRNLMNGHPS